jgi:SAM-dependent methyltransferase
VDPNSRSTREDYNFKTSTNEKSLEEASCVLCGGVGSFLHSFDTVSFRHCTPCNVTFLSPRFTENALLELYKGTDYFAAQSCYGQQGYSLQKEALELTYLRFLSSLGKNYRLGGDLLEIGTGPGYFLKVAKPFFNAVDGLEFSDPARQEASTYARTMFSKPLDSLNFKQQYDVIIGHQLIEHIYNPLQFLSYVRGALKPGGIAVFSTPHASSFWRRILGQRWPSYKPPEHVYLYSPQCLKALLERAGFSLVHAQDFPHAFPAGLIIEKIHVGLSQRIHRALPSLSKKAFWIPATVFSVVGQVDC